jgi:hypothetical protein
LVIACRLSRDPSVSREMDQESPLLNFVMSARRVSSPSAAKTGA